MLQSLSNLWAQFGPAFPKVLVNLPVYRRQRTLIIVPVLSCWDSRNLSSPSALRICPAILNLYLHRPLHCVVGLPRGLLLMLSWHLLHGKPFREYVPNWISSEVIPTFIISNPDGFLYQILTLRNCDSLIMLNLYW